MLGEDGRHSHRAVFIIDRGGISDSVESLDPDMSGSDLLHQIPWFQPRRHRGQFMEIFRALGSIQGFE